MGDIESIEVGIIGYGKVGRLFTRAFTGIGLPVKCILSRSQHGDTWLTERKIHVASRISQLPEGINFLLLCVPDRELPQLAQDIVAAGVVCQGAVIAHTAGAYSAEILAPVRQCGAAVLSWHPLQTFTGSETPECLNGVTFGIDGDPGAVEIGGRIAVKLGGNPCRIAPSMRAQYHLGAVFACNMVTALLGIAIDLMRESGMSEDRAVQAVTPLILSTVSNISVRGLPDSITGPVIRGDIETIRNHLDILQTHQQIKEVYRLLCRHLIERYNLKTNREEMLRILQ